MSFKSLILDSLKWSLSQFAISAPKNIDNLAAFEGSCVHYWASPLEGRLCAGQEVALVGAGNSAGQAVVYLSSRVAKVWLIVSGPSLDASMSRYLVDRIAARPNVEVLTETTVTALDGQAGILEAIRCRSQRSGKEVRRAIRHLFLFIGAEPNTAWLSGSGVTLDDKGFVRTGANVLRALETSLPGAARPRSGSPLESRPGLLPRSTRPMYGPSIPLGTA